MSVKVVAVTKPVVEGLNSPGEFIAYTARVSNPGNQLNTETSQRLLAYLVRNQHWSPFEMVHVVMQIDTTRDIARQILRHRSFSFQEFSQRYADVASMGDMFTSSEVRLQDTKNRQNSIDTEDARLANIWEDAQRQIMLACAGVYKEALDMGVAKEVARKVLPEGLTKSRLYMAGSVRSWMHYCGLRMANGTQKEHRDIATAAWQELVLHVPEVSTSLNF